MTVSVSVRPAAVTVSVKVIISVDDGAVNVGCAVAGLLSVMVEPSGFAQEYVSVRPLGSEEPVPSSVTVVPYATV